MNLIYVNLITKNIDLKIYVNLKQRLGITLIFCENFKTHTKNTHQHIYKIGIQIVFQLITHEIR